MNESKKLFDLITEKSEGIEGELHIIDISDYSYDESLFDDVEKFRIYHGQGFCFNVEKYRIIDVDLFNESFDENENIDGYYYYFISDLFDGYKKLELSDAILLIKKYK